MRFSLGVVVLCHQVLIMRDLLLSHHPNFIQKVQLKEHLFFIPSFVMVGHLVAS